MSSTLILQPRIASATTPVVVVVAGDISCSPTDPNFNSGNGQPGYCQEQATATLVHTISPSYLLPGGDTQYTPSATYAEGQQTASSDYSGGYGASWGQLQVPSSPLYVPNLIVRPTPGDHEYGDYNENDRGLSLNTASSYYSYFGPSGLNDLPAGVTQPSNDFYSFNIPVGSTTWHVISLDSECAALPGPGGTTPSGSAAGCAAGSPEETFLQNDLAANQGACTIIHWHEPLISTYFGYDSDYQAFWNDAAKYHVSLIVNGHDHDYERSNPMNANQVATASGVTQIIAGTGGTGHAGPGTFTNPNLAAIDLTDFGVLQLTLNTTSADYAFKTVSGTTPDSGTVNCQELSATTVTSVSPTSGSAGASVTITGTNLSGASAVDFGSTAGTITADTATSITATAPSGSGPVDVTVTTPSGGTSVTSSNDTFTYPVVPLPTVTSISPTSGPAAGASVTITGTNLASASAVTFGSTAATITTDTATSIVVTAPSGTGPVDVTVTTPGGTSVTSSADKFTYVGAPTVSSISPTSGPASTSVTITGTNLSGASAVDFGSTAAAITADTNTSITATAPSGSGTVDVTVTTPSGGTSVTSSNDKFTYPVVTSPPPPPLPSLPSLPTVTSISPTSGSAGAIVTITGTNLAGASAVTFGTTSATIIGGTNTSVTASAPSGTGTVDVTVTTAGGTSATSSNDVFTYPVVTPSPPPPPPPTLTPPNPPTKVRASIGDGTVRVTWAPPTNTGGTPLTDYTVVAKPKTGKSIVDKVVPSVRSVVLAHLDIGVVYTVRVTAGNSMGQSVGSAPITVVPLRNGGLAYAPRGLRATAQGTRTVITWSAPANDGGFALTGYQVGEASKMTATGGKLIEVKRLPVSKRTFVLNNLPRNFRGYFFVAAINAKGVGTREWLRLP